MSASALDGSAHGPDSPLPASATAVPVGAAIAPSPVGSVSTGKEKELSNGSPAVLRIVIAAAVVLPAAAFVVSHASALHRWKGGLVIEWLGRHAEIPLAIAVAYLVFVFTMPKLLPSVCVNYFVGSETMKCVLSCWNLFFAVFSCIGFVYSLPSLVNMTRGRPIRGLAPKTNRVNGKREPAPVNMTGSVQASLCYWNASVFQDGMSAFWLLAFDLSKIVEMMDTVFLVMKGKRILFLHWYHHLTVMLFCWHAHVTYISNGLWFAVINMGIHTIMYFYYFCFSCGCAKLVKPFAMLITSLQIVQMVTGLVLQVLSLTYYLRLGREHAALGNGANCDTNMASLIFGLLMYGSYFVLFIAFFARVYGKDGRGGSGEGGSRARRGRDKSAAGSTDSKQRVVVVED